MLWLLSCGASHVSNVECGHCFPQAWNSRELLVPTTSCRCPPPSPLSCLWLTCAGSSRAQLRRDTWYKHRKSFFCFCVLCQFSVLKCMKHWQYISFHVAAGDTSRVPELHEVRSHLYRGLRHRHQGRPTQLLRARRCRPVHWVVTTNSTGASIRNPNLALHLLLFSRHLQK